MFKLAYKIYADTRVGKWVHNSQLKAEAHRDFSQFKMEIMEGVDLHIVPYASDNYGYILHNKVDKMYVLVDPADPAMVQKVLEHFEIAQQSNL